uniref:Uncharacterized protein n=1 Tax=Arundo donax TaxID=35708 RepID=A0A0A9AB45_ARUDO
MGSLGLLCQLLCKLGTADAP